MVVYIEYVSFYRHQQTAKNVIQMEVYREAAICPANSKQSGVLRKSVVPRLSNGPGCYTAI